MQKSGFSKMRHYVGFSQIGSHLRIVSGKNFKAIALVVYPVGLTTNLEGF